jgi:hypothetical protein
MFSLKGFIRSVYQTREPHASRQARTDAPVQVDDQNDSDNVADFCTVFVTVRRSVLHVVLEGPIPATVVFPSSCRSEVSTSTQAHSRLTIRVPASHVESLLEVAEALLAVPGSAAPRTWAPVAVRTARSLERLVRAVREYQGVPTPMRWPVLPFAGRKQSQWRVAAARARAAQTPRTA